jgi:hypothetical protein
VQISSIHPGKDFRTMNLQANSKNGVGIDAANLFFFGCLRRLSGTLERRVLPD